MNQVIDPLPSRGGMVPVSELSPMGTQAITQSPLLRTHVWVRLTLMYGERLQRDAGTGLRHVSRVYDGPLKLIPQTC